MSSVNSIAFDKLARLIGTPKCPALLDVRADEAFSADPRLIPGSVRRSPDKTDEWAGEFHGRTVVVIGSKGLKVSHGVAALLREAGYGKTLYMHGALASMNTLYEKHGVALGPTAPATDAARNALPGEIVIAPPSAIADKWARRLATLSTKGSSNT